MSVKNKLSGLLLSTLLLTACAAEEAAPIEEGGMGGVTDEELQQEESVDEVELDEVTFESVQDVYFHSSIESVENDLPELDNLERDTAEIAGVYRSKDRTAPNEDIIFPYEEWVEVNEDGTYTRIRYYVFDVELGEYSEFIDKNVESFAEGLDYQELEKKMGAIQHGRTYARDNGRFAMYVDNNNELQVKDGESITLEGITIDSGLLATEYGEVRYVPVDGLKVYSRYDSNGEAVVSDLLNKTYDDVESSTLGFSGELNVSDKSFDIEALSEESIDNLPINDFIRDGKLKSAHQIQTDLNIMNLERKEKETEAHKQNNNPYFYNDNEYFLMYQHSYKVFSTTVINDTANLKGYMKDNTEFEPRVAFDFDGSIYALTEDGIQLRFDKNDNTWNPSSF